MGELTYKQFKDMAARFRAAGDYANEFGCYYNMYRLDKERTYNELYDFRERLMANMATCRNLEQLRKTLKESYRISARDYFDDYCIFIEFERPLPQRFYWPRRKQLLPIAMALQKLATTDLELLAISLPPGVGKSTLAIFFLTWLAGRRPTEPILGGSHSMSFLSGVYSECLRIMTGGEYLWPEVFPGVRIVGTNAADLRIDLDKPKRFETLEFSSINSGNAGKVRARQLLYCDDLIDGIETAMSKTRLDKLWQTYTTDLRQRKQGDHCKELHIATRWSLYDPIGRLQEMYAGSDKALFIAIPALDENDESNFDYPFGVGFNTQFYHDQRRSMDDASWRALYMNEPIERDGTLYDRYEMRYYFDLPDKEPDAIVSVCDTADNGGDFWVMPIAYKYGQDYYIDRFVCDNGKPNLVENKIINVLCSEKVELIRFESNRAGGRTAERVQKELRNRGARTRVTTKWSQTNKETRIIVSSGYVKEHFLFKNPSAYENDKEYRQAMLMLFAYSMVGKNNHDDVPDALASLADMVGELDGNKVTVMRRPW